MVCPEPVLANGRSFSLWNLKTKGCLPAGRAHARYEHNQIKCLAFSMKRKRSDFVAQTGSGQPDIIMWICRCVRCPDVGGSTGDQRSAVVLPALRARRRPEMRGRWNHGKQPGTTRFLKTRSKTRRNFVRRLFGAVSKLSQRCQDKIRIDIAKPG